MKRRLCMGDLPDPVVLLSCSSHEDRCRGLLNFLDGWSPEEVLLFRYSGPNSRRDRNHATMEASFGRIGAGVVELPFDESEAASSFGRTASQVGRRLARYPSSSLLIDISVLTKRHLLMLLQWADDQGLWDRLHLVYTEPGDYVVSDHIPLSYGLASLQQVPGFPACPDLSRPVHLVVFLGFEGDRALAAYEHTQPMKTTLAIPTPPYRPSWAGRTEAFNRDLLALVGTDAVLAVDPLDPDAATQALMETLGSARRNEFAGVVCPLGTKPQTLGVYEYARAADDPPALLYASPLRHNSHFYSDGVGPTWLIKAAPGT